MNSTFGHRDAVDLQTAALHLDRRRCRAAGHPHLRPGACVQRPRFLRAAGACGRYRAAGRGLRALRALGEALARKAQRERADLRAAYRRRRRPHVLQLPGSSGENGDRMKNAFPREQRLALRWCCSALLVTLAFAPLGCKRKQAVVQPAGDEAPSMASTIHMGDPQDRDPAHQRLLRNRAERLAVDRAAVQPGAAPAVRRGAEGRHSAIAADGAARDRRKAEDHFALRHHRRQRASARNLHPGWRLYVHARGGAGAARAANPCAWISNWTNPCRPAAPTCATSAWWC